MVDYSAVYIFGLNFDKVNGVFVSSDALIRQKNLIMILLRKILNLLKV